MKPTKFDVVFTNHNVESVSAFNLSEARILGQAEQIKQGCSHNIEFVREYLDNGGERIHK